MTESSCKCLPKRRLPDNLKKHVTLDYSHHRNVSTMKDQLQQRPETWMCCLYSLCGECIGGKQNTEKIELFTGEYVQV